MSLTDWYTFSLLIASIATGLFMLGYRWYDHDATAVGAVIVTVLMASAHIKETRGRSK